MATPEEKAAFITDLRMDATLRKRWIGWNMSARKAYLMGRLGLTASEANQLDTYDEVTSGAELDNEIDEAVTSAFWG